EGEGESIEDVALSFLLSNGLIKPAPIRVGSKEFTEQLILGKLLVLLLRDAGFEAEDLTGAGGTALIRQMVEAGEIDVYPEYTGTATSVHHGIPVTALPTTAERAYVLAKSLDAPQGLTWLTPFAFNNTYTLLARQELIDEGIQTIDDLAVYMNANDAPLTICVEGEFYARPDGLDGLQTLYGFAFQEDNILVVETGDVYEKLRNGECDLAEGFSTDGRITAWNFVPLEDSLAFFPFYNPAPVVRQEVLDLHPEIAGLLNQLSGLLDEATMAALNAQVDIGPDGELASGDEASVEEVAYNFLRANRLVALPEIVVASTDATEGFQSILSNMLMLLLADAGYQPVAQTDLGGNLAVRTAMLNGEVDLYIETVTTALAEYHGLPVAALPTTSERAYALAQNLDRENDIVWLDLLPYAETTALVEGEELTTLGIASLDDLALYMIANDSPLAICMDNEFFGSELNGIEALQQLYGFAFEPDKILLMAEDELLAGLESGECDVAATNRLDAAARGYTILEDPLGFFLTSGSAPVMRKTILDQNPELGTVINGLVALLDAETISDLDRQVELGEDGEEESGDEHDAYTVARDFLVENELIEPPVEEPAVDEAAEEGAGSQSTERENPAVEETGTEAPPADATPTEGEGGGETGQTPSPPDSPALTQTSPSAEMLASASAGGGEGDAATASASSPGIAREPGIIIASMTDTEQQLMGTMMVTLLRSAGYPVVDRTASGTSPDLRAMLESGEIDLYPEFTGVALSLYHNIPPSALPTTADGAFSLVKDLDAALNIAWIRKASFDSTYGLAVSPAVAARGLRTLLDLTAAVQADPTALTICVDDDFFNDVELGLASLAELYEMKPSPESIVLLADDEIYRSLRDGTCDVGKISRTDARVGAWQLTVLDDPLGAFPNYSPAPVTRNEVLARYPEMEQRLAALGPLLTPEVITDLNAQIELGQDGEPATGDEASIAQVATTFLCENQLMGDCTVIDNVATTATVMPDGTAAPDVTTEITPVLAMIPITNVTPGEASTLDLLVNEAIAAEEAVAPTAEPVVVSPTEENDESRPADADITISTPATFGVNAREAANATATVVAILPRATTVQAIGRTVDSSWLQILTADGEVAWVFTAAVISNPDRIAQLPVVDPAE
ncbi:MAG: SH3 domain-containing protein, partial [Caldilineaceae bacterium]|nr:SH3 domain-containing protein [Caldilineaceae bacterium]